jgi:iron(III) transport system ATP-binding protein
VASVQLKNITKKFDDVIAVNNISLTIHNGEFFSLLGPSGCGKTTVLRIIAGFYVPTSGEVLFNDKDVSTVPPNKRNTGMVFQNYALFPHMTVFENVAFGLRARKIPKQECRKRVDSALELVDLSGYCKRKVTLLSGGQQQRVALARAIVIEPAILLMDEPLSNLDAKLRRETRDQIRNLQKKLKITTIYVTHDQEEALTLSDRIAVMEKGVCQQMGTPDEIINNPANEFVASFIS